MTNGLVTKIRFRVALWRDARLLPLRARRDRPLAEVLSLASPPQRVRYTGLPAAYVLKHVMRTTRRPILMRDRRCLRQGILAYRFMTAAGHKSELHFGVDQPSLAGSVRAHCWLVHDGRTVLNPPDAAMVPILVHGSDRPDITTAVSARSYV